jgi:hypothetical protein
VIPTDEERAIARDVARLALLPTTASSTTTAPTTTTTPDSSVAERTKEPA